MSPCNTVQPQLAASVADVFLAFLLFLRFLPDVDMSTDKTSVVHCAVASQTQSLDRRWAHRHNFSWQLAWKLLLTHGRAAKTTLIFIELIRRSDFVIKLADELLPLWHKEKPPSGARLQSLCQSGSRRPPEMHSQVSSSVSVPDLGVLSAKPSSPCRWNVLERLQMALVKGGRRRRGSGP